MKRYLILILLLISVDCHAFSLWGDASLGFGGSIAGLPAASTQSAYFPFDSTVNSSPTGTPAGTFTRAGGAINPETGAWANENLLTYSNTFSNAAWTKVAGGTGSSPSLTESQPDPFGGTGATRIVLNKGAGNTITDVSNIYQLATLGTTGTSSVWVKSNTGADQKIVTGSGPSNVGEVTIGTTWTRLTLTSADANRVQFQVVGTISTVNSADILVYGAQLQRGTTAGPYLATTTAAKYDSPRYVTGKQGQALLVESSATQLLVNTNDFTQATWRGTSYIQGTGSVTVTGDYADGPFTGTRATRVLMNLAAGANAAQGTNRAGIKQDSASLAVSPHTFSIYVKPLDSSDLMALYAAGKMYFGPYLSGGTSVAGTPDPVDNGWYRFTATATSTGVATGSSRLQLISNTGSTTSTLDVLVYSPQLETGPYATSYIPNTASSGTVTRAAETDSYSTSGIISDTGGTLMGWFKPEGVAAGKVQTIWSSYTGAADYTSVKYNGVILYAEKAKTGQVTEYVTIASTLTANTWHHWALTINADGTLQLYLDGVGASAGLGSELITNGDMSSATGWTAETGWSIGSNVATAAGVANNYLYQVLPVNKVYQSIYTCVSRTAGEHGFAINGSYVSITRTTTGTFTDQILSGTSGGKSGLRGATVLAGIFDNVSVKEVYNGTSTAFAPVIASTMQVGSYNSTLQADSYLDNFRFNSVPMTAQQILKMYNSGK